MSSQVSNPNGTIDPELLEIQKKLYREQLIKQAAVKRGSKYYPMNIEPFALERDRLALPFTDEDRALRKQWLDDQVLSDREPVKVPQWQPINIFRRIYRKPFDSITNIVRPVLGPEYSTYFRWFLPKITVGLFLSWVFWYQVKYSHRNWENGKRGFRMEYLSKPVLFPGQPEFPNHPILTKDFGMEDFGDRKAFLGNKLVTSGP